MSEYKKYRKEIPSAPKQHNIVNDSIYSSQTVFSAFMTLA